MNGKNNRDKGSEIQINEKMSGVIHEWPLRRDNIPDMSTKRTTNKVDNELKLTTTVSIKASNEAFPRWEIKKSENKTQ